MSFPATARNFLSELNSRPDHRPYAAPSIPDEEIFTREVYGDCSESLMVELKFIHAFSVNFFREATNTLTRLAFGRNVDTAAFLQAFWMEETRLEKCVMLHLITPGLAHLDVDCEEAKSLVDKFEDGASHMQDYIHALRVLYTTARSLLKFLPIASESEEAEEYITYAVRMFEEACGSDDGSDGGSGDIEKFITLDGRDYSYAEVNVNVADALEMCRWAACEIGSVQQGAYHYLHNLGILLEAIANATGSS